MRQHRCASGIAHAKLELPLLGPGLLLLVLAKFNEKGVATLGQSDLELILVYPRAAMIFITLKNKFTVVPYFPSVFTTESQFYVASLGGLIFGVRKCRHLF